MGLNSAKPSCPIIQRVVSLVPSMICTVGTIKPIVQIY